MNLNELILNIIFFGTSGIFALLSLLAIFVFIKYGQNPVVTIVISCIYGGLFFIGFFAGLTFLT